MKNIKYLKILYFFLGYSVDIKVAEDFAKLIADKRISSGKRIYIEQKAFYRFKLYDHKLESSETERNFTTDDKRSNQLKNQLKELRKIPEHKYFSDSERELHFHDLKLLETEMKFAVYDEWLKQLKELGKISTQTESYLNNCRKNLEGIILKQLFSYEIDVMLYVSEMFDKKLLEERQKRDYTVLNEKDYLVLNEEEFMDLANVMQANAMLKPKMVNGNIFLDVRDRQLYKSQLGDWKYELLGDINNNTYNFYFFSFLEKNFSKISNLNQANSMIHEYIKYILKNEKIFKDTILLESFSTDNPTQKKYSLWEKSQYDTWIKKMQDLDRESTSGFLEYCIYNTISSISQCDEKDLSSPVYGSDYHTGCKKNGNDYSYKYQYFTQDNIDNQNSIILSPYNDEKKPSQPMNFPITPCSKHIIKSVIEKRKHIAEEMIDLFFRKTKWFEKPIDAARDRESSIFLGKKESVLTVYLWIIILFFIILGVIYFLRGDNHQDQQQSPKNI